MSSRKELLYGFSPETAELPKQGTLRLVLDPEEYWRVPNCNSCGAHYNLHQRFSKTFKNEDGLLVQFADLETGFRGAAMGKKQDVLKPVFLNNEQFQTSQLDSTDQDQIQHAILKQPLFNLVFQDEDWRNTYTRLRSHLTSSYSHPGQECKGKKYVRISPPRTSYEWAAPLFTAMYGLGASARDITVRILFLEGEENPGVCNTVNRQIKNMSDQTGNMLHVLNHNKVGLEWHPKTPGMSLEIAVKGTAHERTPNWLNRLTDKYSQFLQYKPNI